MLNQTPVPHELVEGIADFAIDLEGAGEFWIREPSIVEHEPYFRLFICMGDYEIEISENDLDYVHQNQIHDEIWDRHAA